MNKPPHPTVILAYDGTGDFGPQTPNTRTAGWQEAIDACVEQRRDLYVQGGAGGRTAIYHASQTIHIPAMQDFRIDGGEYVLNWTGPSEQDLLVVDSSMDCHYRFGILVYGGRGAALRVKPQHPVPIDGFAVFIDSDIRTSSIADPSPFQRGERKGGVGVIFDTSEAAILHAHFFFTAVLNFATCIVAPDTGEEFAYNEVECGHLHTNADRSTLLRLGKQSVQNTLKLRVGVDQGATEVKGIDVWGRNNVLEVTTRGGFPKGGDLLFEPPATGNQVNLIQRKEPLDPLDLITDQATHPTNQVTWTGAPAPIRQLPTTPGRFAYTQRLYPAHVRLVGGKVAEIFFIRGADRLDWSALRGSEMTLCPGGSTGDCEHGGADAGDCAAEGEVAQVPRP